MKRAALLALLVIVPILVLGQTSNSILGPTPGVLFDRDGGTLRPLLGIVGSSTVGPPIDVGFTMTQAVVLPDQRNVIAVAGAGSVLVSIDLGTRPPAVRQIPGTARSAVEISVSPGGTAAALSYPAARQVQVITGLPRNPIVILGLSTALFGTPLRRVVVNDDGSALALSFAEGERETIYRWNRTEGFRYLASTQRVGAMSFVGTTELVFADSGSNEVFLARDVKRQSAVQFIAGPNDGVSRPVGAAVSNRNEILVANAGTGTVMTFEAGGRMLGIQQCDCPLSGLYPLGTAVFRLTDRINQAIYILDADDSENRIAFIPALK